MNQYIVDASIVVQLFITSRYTAETKQLFEGIDRGDQLIVPEFCLLECTNVLWKNVRFHNVTYREAEKLIRALIELDILTTPIIDLLPRALEIGLKYQLAVYDSVYIALAEKLDYPLITDDGKQANAAASEGITLKPITDFTS